LPFKKDWNYSKKVLIVFFILKEDSMSKKILCVLAALVVLAPCVLFAGGKKDSGLIKVGIINNPPARLPRS